MQSPGLPRPRDQSKPASSQTPQVIPGHLASPPRLGTKPVAQHKHDSQTECEPPCAILSCEVTAQKRGHKIPTWQHLPCVPERLRRCPDHLGHHPPFHSDPPTFTSEGSLSASLCPDFPIYRFHEKTLSESPTVAGRG